jgi:hypothetical protein
LADDGQTRLKLQFLLFWQTFEREKQKYFKKINKKIKRAILKKRNEEIKYF